jgi:uncharacterized SAM-binding protein YcdF (DUF218 family)
MRSIFVKSSNWFRVFAVVLVTSLAVIHFTPLVSWYARRLAGDWTDASGDTLIILSSDVERDGMPGYTSYLRSLYGVRAWREHPFQKVIVTGGMVPNAPRSVAASMADLLVAGGVPRDKIVLEEKSVSTHENAVLTRSLKECCPGKVVLLTSDFHMFRARRAFEKAGLHVVPRPLPDVLKRSTKLYERWDCCWILAIETAKIADYYLRGWI